MTHSCDADINTHARARGVCVRSLQWGTVVRQVREALCRVVRGGEGRDGAVRGRGTDAADARAG